MAFKLALLMLVSRFLVITCRFSGSTNDSSAYRIRAAVVFVGAALMTFTFLILGFVGLVMRSWPGWAFCALAGLDAYVLYLCYRRFYNSNSFDLMSSPRR
jgi:hypothetical protein